MARPMAPLEQNQLTNNRFFDTETNINDIMQTYLIFLASVNFFRFNAKIWQFTMYFAVITQKIGNLLCILSYFTCLFGVNFILQKFCPCKKKRQI